MPTPAILPPTCSNLSPTFESLTILDSASSASFSSRSSSCSVSKISRWRASYLSFPRVPFSSCCFACSCAVFRASSFSFVEPIASLSSRCFCESSSVFLGSSLRSLLTSLSWVWVDLIVPLTFFRALSRPVVSPPISTVIPVILLAIVHLLWA